MSSDDQFDEDVVYQKRDVDEAEIEDVWDDSVLIKMYDEMIDKTYDSLGEQYNAGSKKKKATTTNLQWHVGDHCMAPYYEDQLWYPAVIKKIDLAHGKCEVLYDVYDDLARVDIADLTKVTENEQESTSSENVKKKSYKQRPSRSASGQTKKYSKSPSKNDSHIVPPLVPPPPLAFARLKTPNDEEALSSMLMSWYMSGYHTGYYQALRDQDGEKKKISK